MGNILSAIRDDIEEYEALCELYGEGVVWRGGVPACYDEHAVRLKVRRDAELQTLREKVSFGVSVNGEMGSIRAHTFEEAQHIKRGLRRHSPDDTLCIVIFRASERREVVSAPTSFERILREEG